jgi:hypothetical protein
MECLGEAQPASSSRQVPHSHGFAPEGGRYAATEVAVIRQPTRAGSLKLLAYSLAAGRLSRPKSAFNQVAKASNF